MFKPYFFFNTRFVILLAVFSFILRADSKAVNIIGADIFYEHVGALTYKVHLVKQRDCSGPLLTSSIDSITLTSNSNSYSVKFSVDTALANHPLNGTFRSNLTPNYLTTCFDPTSIYTGWQYFHFVGEVSLPYAASDWEFKWEGDSRGTNMTNIVDSTICLRAGLNNLVRANNSSQFTSAHYLNLYENQLLNYLSSPVDPDLDSLVFTNETPSTDLGSSTGCSPVQYISPYSNANPMASSSPFQFSSVTGTATFTPNLTGKYLLKFRSTEYDPVTSDYLGFVEREIQLHVLNAKWPLVLNDSKSEELAISIFPNPVSHTLNFKLSKNNKNETLEVKLYNSFGQKVLVKNMNISESLHLEFLPAGFYYTELKVGEQIFRKLLVKE